MSHKNNNIRSINIDNITIRLPAGWQGDATLLARKISEQLQTQALDLTSSKQISLSLQGHFGGNTKAVINQFSRLLKNNKTRRKARGLA